VYWDKVKAQYLPKHTAETARLFGYSKRYATQEQMFNRRNHGYRGTGDYERGPLGGRFIPFMRKLPWAKIGKVGLAAARAGLGAYRGLGDYDGSMGEASAPVSTYGPAVDNQLISGGNAPISVNASDDLTGDITFSHTEFVMNITATTTNFENRELAINPGLSSTFPFLSQLAANFTMYDLQGLIFEYRPTSGELGANSNALGKVIMATNYDPDAPAFTTSRIMENYDYATATKPSLVARHGVETANGQQALEMMYIRQGEVTRDKIFTDLGKFQIATEGLPNTGQVGELWVTYTCRLSRSRINTEGTKSAYYTFSGVGNNSPLNQPVVHFDSIGLTYLTNDQTIQFPQEAKGKAFLLRYTIQYGTQGQAVVDIPAQPVAIWSGTGKPAPIRWREGFVDTTNPSSPTSIPAQYRSELTTNVPVTITNQGTTIVPSAPVLFTTQKGYLLTGTQAAAPEVGLRFSAIQTGSISLVSLHVTELDANFAEEAQEQTDVTVV